MAEYLSTRMTPKRIRIVTFILEFTKEHGYPPTWRDIGVHLGVSSTNAVNDHIKALRKLGVIRTTPNVARSIVVIGATNPPE